ncbi:MAG: right-handed parallel beta-helix repeat-containing protein [Phycisphaerae bacterium]|nr:right-handed parallel beta-helix repeat-containing protein [Phycisphaerae bacterium]
MSIAINPTNPNNLVVIAFHPADQNTMNTFWSTDGGQTWTANPLDEGKDGKPGMRHDPTVAFDDNGHAYVAYSAANGTNRVLLVGRSTDGGVSYTLAKPVAGPNCRIDKYVINTGPGPYDSQEPAVYIAYTQFIGESDKNFTNYELHLAACYNWDDGFTVDEVINNESTGGGSDCALYGMPAVDSEGRVYVVWIDYSGCLERDTTECWYHEVCADPNTNTNPHPDDYSACAMPQIKIDRGTFDGENLIFGTDDQVVQDTLVGYSYCIPAMPRNKIGSVPTVAVDRSGGPYDGRIYVAYTVVGGEWPNDQYDTDIELAFLNQNEWDERPQQWHHVEVHGAADGASQFLPWLNVDQVTGQVAVVWYDTRDDPGMKEVRVYLALSSDGGESWDSDPISDGQSEQSEPDSDEPYVHWYNNFREYIGLAIHDSVAHAVWADNSDQDQDLDVYTDRVSTRLYVRADANLGGDGKSWGTAFKYLRDALDAVNNEPIRKTAQIRVAAGAYRPDVCSVEGPRGQWQTMTSGLRTDTFSLTNNLMIRGGYSGQTVLGNGSGTVDVRDVVAFETILTGDIGTQGDNTDNSYHVVTAGDPTAGIDTDSSAVLDGFTIKDGNANHPSEVKYRKGGGLYNDGGSAELSDCAFTQNEAAQAGGGMYTDGGHPTLSNCQFIANIAFLEGQPLSGDGGGLYSTNSNSILVNCLFIENRAGNEGGAVCKSGGGMGVYNCVLKANTAKPQGTGGFYSQGSPFTMINNILWGNSGAHQIVPQTVSVIVMYNCIDGGYNDGIGNISDDPAFFDESANDLRLSAMSPCIDMGDPDFDEELIDKDISGYPRVVCDRVDMGTYEFPYRGDMNHDTLVNGDDIQLFTDCFLAGSPPDGICNFADMDATEGSGGATVDEADKSCFASVLTDGFTSCDLCTQSAPPGGVGAPRQERESSDGALPREVPRLDCNRNGVRDAEDIAEGTSQDCNSNGVPDECDIDAGDPDGDGRVSPDCNKDGLPDECNLALPIFTSFDCNGNGIPDECDIAAGRCKDCNGNGFPDACDISSRVSEDKNANGVPDECENAEDVRQDVARAAFYEWYDRQAWGPKGKHDSRQQFQMVVDKLRELGLPLRHPWLEPEGPGLERPKPEEPKPEAESKEAGATDAR